MSIKKVGGECPTKRVTERPRGNQVEDNAPLSGTPEMTEARFVVDSI